MPCQLVTATININLQVLVDFLFFFKNKEKTCISAINAKE